MPVPASQTGPERGAAPPSLKVCNSTPGPAWTSSSRASAERPARRRRPIDHDPEDRIALLCGVMAAFAGGSLTAGEAGPGEALFFNRHLAPWAGMFFDDLEKAPAAKFYAAVGRVGRLFMEIEAQGFALDADATEAA